MCCQENEVEPVVDLIDAIFDGDACHRLSLRNLALICWLCAVVIGARAISQDEFVIWRYKSALLTPAADSLERLKSAGCGLWTRKRFIASSKPYVYCPELTEFAVVSVVGK